MMKKKEYQRPQIKVILLKNNFRTLLQASEKKLPLVEEETIEQI